MNVRVFGIGADVAHVPRFQRAFARYGDRFLRRAFHPDEIREFYCKPPAARASFLASRWAVKEAAFKAFQRYRVLFPEICVARQESDESAAAVASVFNVVTQLSVAETPRALRLEFSGKTALLAEQLGLVGVANHPAARSRTCRSRTTKITPSRPSVCTLPSPGIYDLTDTIVVNNPNTIVLGLGLATLHPVTGKTAIATAD
ncbi:hypothetical protein PybrP1_011394, partial [[Pythium] brassicae (nom. inval.)]